MVSRARLRTTSPAIDRVSLLGVLLLAGIALSPQAGARAGRNEGSVQPTSGKKTAGRQSAATDGGGETTPANEGTFLSETTMSAAEDTHGSDAAHSRGDVQVVMGPFLRDLTGSEVTVVFRTDQLAKAAVLYRVPGGTDTRLEDPAPTVHHEFPLKPLAPGQIYVYRLVVDGKEMPGGGFTTPPNPQTPVIIGVYGDTRKYNGPHAEVCAGLVRRSVDLLIHTGDLVHDGFKQSDWLNFFRIERALLRSTPMYPVIGNHDNRGKMGKWWFTTLFGLNSRYRSIDYGPVHLVILNSEGEIPQQARWLEDDLKKVRENPLIHYILAFIHHGPYGTGEFNGNKAVARYLAPVLRKYGPSIVFSGHEHDYERGEVDGLPFYVTGGGGAVLTPRVCHGKCPEWSKIWKKIYHYMIVEASPTSLRICAYHPSGAEVEPCISYPIPQRNLEAAADAASQATRVHRPVAPPPAPITGASSAAGTSVYGLPAPSAEEDGDEESDDPGYVGSEPNRLPPEEVPPDAPRR